MSMNLQAKDTSAHKKLNITWPFAHSNFYKALMSITRNTSLTTKKKLQV